MGVLLQTTLVLLLAALSAAQSGSLPGPTYLLENFIAINNSAYQQAVKTRAQESFSTTPYYEWEGYDGWFNNPAHPEWGGAGKP